MIVPDLKYYNYMKAGVSPWFYRLRLSGHVIVMARVACPDFKLTCAGERRPLQHDENRMIVRNFTTTILLGFSILRGYSYRLQVIYPFVSNWFRVLFLAVSI